jgi:hypothetical protein
MGSLASYFAANTAGINLILHFSEKKSGKYLENPKFLCTFAPAIKEITPRRFRAEAIRKDG